MLPGLLVTDVVVRLPKTLPMSTTVGDARGAFEDDHVHMLLITEGGRLLGTLVRDDLPADAEPDETAIGHAVLDGRTVAPAMDAEEARQLLLAGGERRRAVVDDDGRLIGLLCLKRRRTGFCSDEDVAARAAELLVTTSEGSLR